MLGRIENNTIVEYPTDIRTVWPNISWPSDLDSIADVELPKNIVRVIDNIPMQARFSTVIPSGFMLSGNRWVRIYNTSTLSEQEIKNIIKQEITDYRFKHEISGIKVGELQIDTSIESQNRMSNAVSNSTRRNLTSISFKAKDNSWSIISIEQLTNILDTIHQFVEQCFDAEKEKHLFIDSMKATQSQTVLQQLTEYDVTLNWPSFTF